MSHPLFADSLKRFRIGVTGVDIFPCCEKPSVIGHYHLNKDIIKSRKYRYRVFPIDLLKRKANQKSEAIFSYQKKIFIQPMTYQLSKFTHDHNIPKGHFPLRNPNIAFSVLFVYSLHFRIISVFYLHF